MIINKIHSNINSSKAILPGLFRLTPAPEKRSSPLNDLREKTNKEAQRRNSSGYFSSSSHGLSPLAQFSFGGHPAESRSRKTMPTHPFYDQENIRQSQLSHHNHNPNFINDARKDLIAKTMRSMNESQKHRVQRNKHPESY